MRLTENQDRRQQKANAAKRTEHPRSSEAVQQAARHHKDDAVLAETALIAPSRSSGEGQPHRYEAGSQLRLLREAHRASRRPSEVSLTEGEGMRLQRVYRFPAW